MSLSNLYFRLSPLLRPLAVPYALLMQGRRSAYNRGFFASFKPDIPTIAIGNISFGGTGKTPLTDWLLTWAETRGLVPAVLTRGYKGMPGKAPLLVGPNTSVRLAGDEPLMLARRHPNSHILAFPRRDVSAEFAQKYLRPDLFILDDGMQHLAVNRHLNIVLLTQDDLGRQWNRVLPGGSWREGKSALSSASAFCIKSGPDEFAALEKSAKERLERLGVPLFSFSLKPLGLVSLFREGRAFGSSDYMPREVYHNKPYVLLSAVGKPGQVEATATAFIGRRPDTHFKFEDHHGFSLSDFKMITRPGLPIVCTAKDAVKLSALFKKTGRNLALGIYVLEVGVEFGPALFTTDDFPAWWSGWWHNHTCAGK